jgi:hypothetical protein
MILHNNYSQLEQIIGYQYFQYKVSLVYLATLILWNSWAIIERKKKQQQENNKITSF